MATHKRVFKYIELEIATVHYRTDILKHEVAAKLQ